MSNLKLGLWRLRPFQWWKFAYRVATDLAAGTSNPTISGKVDWLVATQNQQAAVGRCTPGDVLVVAEISRLARSTLQVLEIMNAAAGFDVAIHVVKNAMVMNGSMQSKICAAIFGLAAEIERDFISQRTRERMARRKVDDIVLGRPRGAKTRTR